MKQPAQILKQGTVIRTHLGLKKAMEGVWIHDQHLRARQSNALGKIECVLAGTGGDLYLVSHSDASLVAVYCWSEFELESAPEETLAPEETTKARTLWDILETDEL